MAKIINHSPINNIYFGSREVELLLRSLHHFGSKASDCNEKETKKEIQKLCEKIRSREGK